MHNHEESHVAWMPNFGNQNNIIFKTESSRDICRDDRTKIAQFNKLKMVAVKYLYNTLAPSCWA